ncbi:MAG: relaxase domain-containing protein [Acidobacteria bacterium]|nr:relaxase domain-containing protein [Acidobacteriota bacterium]MCI0718754.1 relaxase domain-containing protein [Acidobacteriota bacterium]
MFTCKKIRNGSTYLGTHLTANDYYCEGEHVMGTWVGKGAELLGMAGHAIDGNDAAFEALRLNQHPDDSGQLTPRNVGDSIRFYDFQCSAQKSVSIMAVTLGDQRLYEAHDRASRLALGELERFAAIQSGQGHRKRRETTGNICAAAFRHDASRELDPQLHTHLVVANATWDGKRWLALETHDIFKAIRYCGKVYQNELARECRRLGYDIESIRNEKGLVEGFEIKGVSTEIRQRFSKRRTQVEAAIEQFIAERGRQPKADEIAELARETRGEKLREITTPEVRALQRAQLSPQELRVLERLHDEALSRPHFEPTLVASEKALTDARKHLFERQSVLPAHAVLAEALNQSLGATDPQKLQTAVEKEGSGFVAVGAKLVEPLNQAFTTPEGLALERWAVGFVNGTQNNRQALGPVEGIAFQFQSDEQRRVVLQTLACTDQVCGIRGLAGAGKTTSLREISRSLESLGQPVYYLAPTASAAKVLKGDGFGTATTVSDFLINQVSNEVERLRNAVLIVDEAGLQSNNLGASLLRVAEKTGARVLFVGDTRQHVSVEAGDFLRILESHSRMRVAELRDIRRQVDQEYNRAIREMAAGRTIDGMERLQRLGWVQEAKGAYLEAAAEAFFGETEGGTRLDRTLAVSPTWAENHRFTDAIRSRLKHAGVLTEGQEIIAHHSLQWTRQQMGDTNNYRPGFVVTFNRKTAGMSRGQSMVIEKVEGDSVYFQRSNKPFEPRWHTARIDVSEPRSIEVALGDRLLIRRNDRRMGLTNGDLVTVSKFDADGTIHTREGAVIGPQFRHFCHGYVVTSHKSQGRTHTSVILAAEEVDAKAAYVACSRGRERCSVFVPDLTHFLKRLPRSGDRTSALDLAPRLSRFEPPLSDKPEFKPPRLWALVKENRLTWISRLREGFRHSLEQDFKEPGLSRTRFGLEPTFGL